MASRNFAMFVTVVFLLTLVLQTAQAEAYGRMRSQLPIGRELAAVAPHDGNVYLFLGCVGQECAPTSEIWRYNPESDYTVVMQAQLPSGVPIRGAAVGTPYGIFVFIINMGTYRYDPHTDTFEDLHVVLSAMAAYGSIPEAGIAVSGFWYPPANSSTDCPSGCVHLLVSDGRVWLFDPLQAQFSKAPVAILPFAPQRQVVDWGFAWMAGYGWLVGGHDYVVGEDRFEASDRIVRYDPVRRTATELPVRLPGQVYSAGVAGNGSTLFAYGGGNQSVGARAEVVAIPAESPHELRRVAPLPVPLRGPSAIWHEGSGFLLGGWTEGPCCPSASREEGIIRHVPGLVNLPPVARIQADLVRDTTASYLRLNGSASFDPDGHVLFWDWVVDGQLVGQVPVMDVAVSARQLYRVALTVTDNAYDSSSAFKTLTAARPDGVDSTSPAAGGSSASIPWHLCLAAVGFAFTLRRARHHQLFRGNP